MSKKNPRECGDFFENYSDILLVLYGQFAGIVAVAGLDGDDVDAIVQVG